MPPSTSNSTKKTAIGAAIDLCCGLGGLSIAAQRCGIEPILGLDINNAALKTYLSAFPGASIIEGDISEQSILDQSRAVATKNNSDKVPLYIFSGPPCQGFSVAGPRDPLDPRNRVITAVSKAIVNLQPEAAIIENVPSILSPRNSKRLASVLNPLFKGGYSVLRIILNAQTYGVPQRRRRAFLIITRKKISEVEFRKNLTKYQKPEITVEEAFKGLGRPPVRLKNRQKARLVVGTPSNHIAMRHSKEVRAKIAALGPGEGPLSYRRLRLDKPAQTLISGHRAPPAHPTQARSITVREAARLQGFPDEFQIYGNFGVQLQQVTNAVPPPLAESVIRALLDTVKQ